MPTRWKAKQTSIYGSPREFKEMEYNATGKITSLVNSTAHGEEIEGVYHIPILVFLILAGNVCNPLAILFISKKESKTTFKDKLVTLLCATNSLNTIGYSIELHSTIKGAITDEACLTSAFLICFLTYTSVGCLVGLVLERCIAIKYPFTHVVWFSVDARHTSWLVGTVISGFLLAFPPLVGWGKYGKARKESFYCGFDFGNNGMSAKCYLIFIVFVVLVIPTVLTWTCIVCIIREIRGTANRNKRMFGRNSIISSSSNKNVQHQYRSSVLTGLVFFASWVPYAIVCFMFYYQFHVPHVFEYVGIYMSKSATISSPIIYCLIERRFLEFIRKDQSFQLQSFTNQTTRGNKYETERF